MNLFIQKLFKFIFTIIFFITFLFLLNSGHKDIFEKSLFDRKLELFNKFIGKKESINLILGSSMAQHAVDPIILGENWFNFATGAQNIYESYIFLNYYKEKVKFDTILISLKPFDFVFSYTKNRFEKMQIISGDFVAFSKDSITSFYGNPITKKFQNLKNKHFKKIDHILSKDLVDNNEDTLIRIFNNQGFFPIINHIPVNLDSIYSVLPFGEFSGNHYYHNVKSSPNMKYFWLFDSLAQSISKKVIYIKTPRSKFYRIGEKHHGYDKFWTRIESDLKFHNKKFWNFSKINEMKFVDDSHIDYQSSQIFTKIIRQKFISSLNNFQN